MKVLNIHGYHGNARNSAFAALDAIGAQFTELLTYDGDRSPEFVITQFERLAARDEPDIIVGTSLGGFYASVLAARTGLPVMLVNPCLMPFLHLPRLGFSGDIRPFMKLFGEIASLAPEKVRVIIGAKDEVIDTHEPELLLFGQERIRVSPEGMHSGATLPLTEFFSEAAGSGIMQLNTEKEDVQ